MQNRNIEERLQILNDYIQRTIDALNATRQVAAQTLGSQIGATGLSHTPYGWTQGWQGQQFVQTPQGLLPVNPYFTSVHPMAQVGYGLQHSGFVPGFVPNVIPTNLGNIGYGLQGVHGVQGLHQQTQFVPGFGFGLQHSTMLPQWQNQWQNVSPWTNVPVSFVPVSHLGVGQMGLNPQVQNRDLGIQNQQVMGQTTI